jgi:alpha-D-ribose 1-methylphosphonate 5-triphosphate synthase subunit PhnL
VALARAFLKSPPLLLCDEATSALDSRTEKEVRGLNVSSIPACCGILGAEAATGRNMAAVVEGCWDALSSWLYFEDRGS